MLAEQVAIGELSRENVAMTGLILLVAGHETTANRIGLGAMALLESPDQATRLRDTGDPRVIAKTVEELLRYLTIAHDMVVGVATEDIAIGGQLVRAGDRLIVSLPAGNRETTVFAEADDFDVDRANARMHVAFEGWSYLAHQSVGVRTRPRQHHRQHRPIRNHRSIRRSQRRLLHVTHSGPRNTESEKIVSAFHPDLTRARFIPKMSYGPLMSRAMRSLKPRGVDPGSEVTVREMTVPGPEGARPVSLRVFQPAGLDTAAPAMLWVHGGGLIFGAPEQDDRTNAAFARELGITVAAVRYRLGPDNPAPAAVEDAYAALRGLVASADELHVDVDRIAIGGASAGGGIAAALVLFAHDRAEIRPVFQLLVYPMLDDRTTTRTDLGDLDVRMWTAKSNRYGWSSYLGDAVAGPDVSPYFAAARREDLSGLPPAWIGVGTLDLFHDEDVEYARRLNDSGVHCELHIVPGAFHGFDQVFAKSEVSQQFWCEQARALGDAL